ncbi:MAG: acyl-CoA dehydrogenase family protein, partial [Nitrososphaerota archaeon]|nr:acyl-CoA dehydrogenase family protein [Nitrososphaerota archaeon]
MLSFELSEDEQEIADAAEKFASREIRPLVLRREWLDDHNARFPWDIFEKAADMGLKNLTVPMKYGGLEASISLACIVAEKIAKADAGVAIVMGHWWKECRLIANAGSQEQQQWFFPEFINDKRYMLATTMSESRHGSDHHLPYENFNLQTTAVMKGDSWVINGSKVFISNGAVARLYLTYATTDTTKNFVDGTSCFLIPRD